MAMASSSLHPLLQQQQTFCPKFPRLSPNFPISPSRLRFSSLRFQSTIRASSSSSSSVAFQSDLNTQQSKTLEADPFACPVSNIPFWVQVYECNKTYSSKDNYLDLTVTAGMKDYAEARPVRTELFRSPIVSFLYERGWRQNFRQSGFPGPDEEFKMAQEYFGPAQGGLIIDVSCGSGLFSRKFAKSGTYSKVIALDFSENMLRQSYDFIKQDTTIPNTNLALVRADVSRLPFASGSVDAVHAGAALHCWQSPSNAIADISRILRSGGVFVGSTFLRHSQNTPWLVRLVRESVMRTYSYYIEEEIEDLCRSCGLTNYKCHVQQSFIMFSAQKP